MPNVSCRGPPGHPFKGRRLRTRVRVGLKELSYSLWRGVTRLYRKDPVVHVYLAYDLLYEIENTRACFEVSGGEIIGYVLAWRGPRVNGVHVWGEAESILDSVPLDRKAVVQVHKQGLVESLLERMSGGSVVELREFLTMCVDERGFTPLGAATTVRLDPGNSHHVAQFRELKLLSGVLLTTEEARRMLRKRRYYGVFADGKLVSIACAYVRMADVWVVGDVFTHPDYRGRGYAKAATSAITGDAVSSGAVAVLHVASGNKPAIRVYRALGYKVAHSTPWIVYVPD